MHIRESYDACQDLNEVTLEGDITVPGAPTGDMEDDMEFNTLDEPVKDTIVSICSATTDWSSKTLVFHAKF